MCVRPASILGVLLVASFVSTGACSKKDSPVDAGAAVATTPAVTPTAPPPEATKAPEAPDAGTEAQAETAAPPKLDVTPVTLGAPIAPPSQAPMALTGVPTYPEGIVAVAGIQSIAGLFADAAVKDGPSAAMALGAIGQRLGVPTLDWVAQDKPLLIAIPDPKKFPDGFVVAVPLAQADLKADALAMPAGTDTEGHFAKLVVRDHALYFDKLGTHLVATSHKDLFKTFGGFIKDTLVTWTPGDTLVLESNIQALMKTYAEELKQAQVMLPMMMEGMAKKGLKMPQGAQMLALVEKLLKFSQDIERATIGVDVRGAFPRIGFAVTAKEGSELAKDLAALGTSKLTMASEIAADAWFALAMDAELDLGFNPSSLIEGIQAALEPQGYGLTADELQRLTSVAEKVHELANGPSAFWFRADGAQPFTMESITLSSDAVAGRDAEVAFLDLIFQKMWSIGRGKMIEAGVPADNVPGAGDTGAVIALVNKLAAVRGMNIALTNGAVAKGLALGIEWSGLPLRGPIAQILPLLVGAKLEIGVAAADKRLTFAMGPTAIARSEALAKATAPAAPPAWLGDAAQTGFALAAFRPAQLAALLAQTPILAGHRDDIAKLPDAPFVLKALTSERSLRFELAIPRELMMALALFF